jgi:hypothetical protein
LEEEALAHSAPATQSHVPPPGSIPPPPPTRAMAAAPSIGSALLGAEGEAEAALQLGADPDALGGSVLEQGPAGAGDAHPHHALRGVLLLVSHLPELEAHWQ